MGCLSNKPTPAGIVGNPKRPVRRGTRTPHQSESPVCPHRRDLRAARGLLTGESASQTVSGTREKAERETSPALEIRAQLFCYLRMQVQYIIVDTF